MEDKLMSGLLNDDRDVQIRAASKIPKLSNRLRQKLVEIGVIVPLISMLCSKDYQAVEVALFALLSVCFASERNKIMIVKAGVVPVLLDLLQYGNDTLSELSVAAMLILSSCKPNKMVVAKSGAIPHLINILNTCHTKQAKLDSISTLHNLSCCHQLVPSMVSSGLTYVLLRLIHMSERASDLFEKAISLLENVVSLSAIAVQEVVVVGWSIRALVEVIEEGSSQCKEHAVGILLAICRNKRDKHRGLILKEGVIPGLLQLNGYGTWRAKSMARELLLLLRDGSKNGSKKKQLKNEVLEQIMEEIDADGERVGDSTFRLVEEMIAKLRHRLV